MGSGLAVEPTIALAVAEGALGLSITLSNSTAGICPAIYGGSPVGDGGYVGLTFEVPLADNGDRSRAGTYEIVPASINLDGGSFVTASVTYCVGCSVVYASSGTLTITSVDCPITGGFSAEFPQDAGGLATTGTFSAPVCYYPF